MEFVRSSGSQCTSGSAIWSWDTRLELCDEWLFQLCYCIWAVVSPYLENNVKNLNLILFVSLRPSVFNKGPMSYTQGDYIEEMLAMGFSWTSNKMCLEVSSHTAVGADHTVWGEALGSRDCLCLIYSSPSMALPVIILPLTPTSKNYGVLQVTLFDPTFQMYEHNAYWKWTHGSSTGDYVVM